ncbi:SBP-like protein [Artemisia annua]|uniref:SBP-like protein n=1 Tax=Artemisia annua TaxID=35608 RepID=A0A2U1QIZ5_ARTAN|nr:SBP-like protein [Artemisia annua]
MDDPSSSTWDWNHLLDFDIDDDHLPLPTDDLHASSSNGNVPGCEVDISELKGYHKRHRVCLDCANASNVVIDGIHKRYCQQCAKFHVLSDFDEGKRSCRRKLERHNNRRRRKSVDPKGSKPQIADYNEGYDEAGKGDNNSLR